jgi:hypothetical protein
VVLLSIHFLRALSYRCPPSPTACDHNTYLPPVASGYSTIVRQTLFLFSAAHRIQAGTMATFSMLAMALLAASLAAPVTAWQQGRATHYGEDAWSIHKGSCGYGQLAQNRGTGAQLPSTTWTTIPAQL